MTRYPEWANRYIDLLRDTCNPRASAEALGVSTRTVNKLRREDVDFDAACSEALEDAYDTLEAEARRRAFDGVEEPVFYQGEHVADVTKYSDSLAMFLLKGYRRAKFGDGLQLTGAGGGPVLVDESVRAARIAQLMAIAQARAASPEDLSDLA